MNRIGIDIGTTSISIVKIDEDGNVLSTVVKKNNSGVRSAYPHDMQDPEIIVSTVRSALEELTAGDNEIASIGICGQMHGILYTYNGKAVSNLYTWRDSSGKKVYRGGMPYGEYICFCTGYKVFSGYGICTHFYLKDKGLLPRKFDKIYTIGDYVAMSLTGEKSVVQHVTMAASLGLFDLSSDDFDEDALAMLEIDRNLLPEVSSDIMTVGKINNDIPVTVAIGDSQSAFYGAGAGDTEMVLNMGTGGQISCIMRNAIEVDGNTELRPYINSNLLYTASSLCGGAAYASLNDFFRLTLAAFGVEKTTAEIYSVMEEFATQEAPLPQVDTAFLGTRKDPAKKGAIYNLYSGTFTPEKITQAFIEGIATELYPYYEHFLNVGPFDGILLTGTLARKCPIFTKVAQSKYPLPIRISPVNEEAAVGAALSSSLVK